MNVWCCGIEMIYMMDWMDVVVILLWVLLSVFGWVGCGICWYMMILMGDIVYFMYVVYYWCYYFDEELMMEWWFWCEWMDDQDCNFGVCCC